MSESIYVVVVRRTDTHEPLWVLETEVKKEAVKCHEDLTLEWAKSASEKRPFVLTYPRVTAFLPALIYEIEVLQMTPQEYQASKAELPSEIKKQGFTGFMNRNGWGS